MNFQEDAFGSVGPYPPLTQAADGAFELVFFDGIQQPSANYIIAGTGFDVGVGVDTSLFDTIRVVYSYA